MSLRMTIEVKIYDDEDGVVRQHVIDEYADNLGYEVERMFDRLGHRFARVMDPYMEAQ